MTSNVSILFLGKADDPYCARALAYLREHSDNVASCLGKWGDPLPDEIRRWEGDYVISYLSRWVVPADLLSRARKAAINFHPASPEYPGIGCNNFALYENAKEYGVTCHHMAPKVDTGSIIAVSRFPVYETDGVAEILERTYEHQFTLFLKIATLIAEGKELPSSNESWTRPPFTRKQFNELFRITPDMGPEKVARHIRAVSFGPWQPYIEIGGFRFEYKPDGEKNKLVELSQRSFTQKNPLKIFLSYASEDRPVVRDLYYRLKNDDFEPWLDEVKLLPGQDWELEITKEINNADVIIVCLSQRIRDKQGMIQKEIKQALDAFDRKPEGTIFLIPLRLEDCIPPSKLTHLHWVDYFKADGYERLKESLRKRSEDLKKYNDLL